MFKITCRQVGRQYIVGRRRTRYPFIVALKDLKIENPASKALLYFQPLAGFTLSKNADKEKSICSIFWLYFSSIFNVDLFFMFFFVSGENPAAMQTGTSHRMQSTAPLFWVFLLLTCTQYLLHRAHFETASSSSSSILLTLSQRRLR